MSDRRTPRVRTGRRRPLSAPPRSPLRTAIPLAIAVIALCVAIFMKDALPGRTGVPLTAVVEDVAALRPGGPVRVAGIPVGKVTGIDRHGDRLSLLRMELDDNAPAIRRDAELKLRPRIFLEGNFFVDLHPGTPAQPELGDAPVPAANTTVAVQIDRVLSTFDTPVRRRLQETLRGVGSALGDDATVTAMRRTLRDSPDALRTNARLADATRGSEERDLTRLVASIGSFSDALVPHVAALRGAVRGLHRTMGAFAAEEQALRATVRTLPGTLARLDRASTAFDTALPALRRISDDLLPGVRATPATIDAARPWVRSTRRLIAPDALRRWIRVARSAAPDLIRFVDDSTSSAPGTQEIARCTHRVMVPAMNLEIRDGRYTLGVENFKGFFYGIAGVSGEAQNFNGTGAWSRVGVGAGPTSLVAGGDLSGITVDEGESHVGVGARPVRPAAQPPYRDDVACSTQPVPDGNRALTARGIG